MKHFIKGYFESLFSLVTWKTRLHGLKFPWQSSSRLWCSPLGRRLHLYSIPCYRKQFPCTACKQSYFPWSSLGTCPGTAQPFVLAAVVDILWAVFVRNKRPQLMNQEGDSQAVTQGPCSSSWSQQRYCPGSPMSSWWPRGLVLCFTLCIGSCILFLDPVFFLKRHPTRDIMWVFTLPLRLCAVPWTYTCMYCCCSSHSSLTSGSFLKPLSHQKSHSEVEAALPCPFQVPVCAVPPFAAVLG